MNRPSKQCRNCNSAFYRNPKHSRKQWDEVAFCSVDCSNKFRATHGLTHTRLYQVWHGIKQRCLNPNFKLFQEYGARGITMCPQWRDDFSAFAADMGPDPGPSFDIGRKDNDQGYFKENCVWETHKKNMRNTRRTLWVDFDGQTMSLAEACEIAGCKYKLTWARLKKGKTLVEAMR